MLRSAIHSRTFLRPVAQREVAQFVTVMSSTANGHGPATSLSVAVIGAGAAGLVAARELQREGHRVTVIEQGSQVGGIWMYSDDIETDDLLGVKQERRKVHGSLYRSLRTNLPRHVMAFTDFPFDFCVTGSDDDRLFCGHEEVLRYLQLFAQAFDISHLVRFNTRVEAAAPIEVSSTCVNGAVDHWGAHQWPRWRLSTVSLDTQEARTETFDALVVCNGHYSEPRVPAIPGSQEFPGRQLHTHNFRENSCFAGQTVVVMGASASGQDIAREIADVAKTVYFSARPVRFGSKQVDWEPSEEPFGPRGNLLRRAVIKSLGRDGSVTFADGTRAEKVDSVVFATGYKFSFPFLDEAGVITVQDNRVSPLYQHLVCTSVPSLSFIGLPWQVIPFPLMELQSKWVARILSGRSQLPSREEMERHTAEYHRQREEAGIPVRYSHRVGEDQWAYNDWLAQQIGSDQPPLPEWRPRMHKTGQANIRERPDSYRDHWPDPELVAEGEAAANKTRQRLPPVLVA